MVIATTLRELDFDDALRAIDNGAAVLDLRGVDAYLEVHVPGSLCNVFEAGPGFATRARDCIPLEVPLVLADLGDPAVDLRRAAASLRGKGFTVLGTAPDAINRWAQARGAPASTEIIEGMRASGGILLDVGDPGADTIEGAVRIPADRLWARIDEIKDNHRVVVAAGYGVRAALVVGILERFGIKDVAFWKTR